MTPRRDHDDNGNPTSGSTCKFHYRYATIL